MAGELEEVWALLLLLPNDISFQEHPLPKLLRWGLRLTLPKCFVSGGKRRLLEFTRKLLPVTVLHIVRILEITRDDQAMLTENGLHIQFCLGIKVMCLRQVVPTMLTQ